MAYVAMYQKFKLIRERNQLECQLMGMTSKLERIGKNITNKEKYYTSLFSKLEQQATNFKNQAKIAFQTGFGLGPGSVNPMNYSGTNGFVLQRLQAYLQDPSQVPVFKDGKQTDKTGMSFSNIESILAQVMQYGKPVQETDSEGKPVTENYTGSDGKEYTRPKYLDMSYDEYLAVNAILNKSTAEYQQAQMMMNQATLNYDTNISIWLDAQKAQLQAEQDSVLGALQYEQTMMQIDKDYCETRLTEIEQLEKSYDEKLKKDIERSVPKFGLG